MSQVLAFSVGALLGVGILFLYIFRKTGVSDILLLLGLGFALQFMKIIPAQLVAIINDYLPIAGTLIIVLIIYDGALGITIANLQKEAKKSLLLAIFGFVFSAAFIAGFGYWLVLPGFLLLAIFLGVALGGTSGAVVAPTAQNYPGLSEETKTRVILESSITDVLCIVGAQVTILLMAGLQATPGQTVIGSVLGAIASKFFMPAFLGLIIGTFVWLKILQDKHQIPAPGMASIAVVLALWGLIEFIGFSGVIGVLAFGIVINNPWFHKIARLKSPISSQRIETLKNLNQEAAIIAKAVFFIAMGLTLKLKFLSVENLLALAIVLVIMAARFLSVILCRILQEKWFVIFQCPRGLAAAVIATMPITYGLGTMGMVTSYQIEKIMSIVPLVIIYSIVLSAVGMWTLKRKDRKLSQYLNRLKAEIETRFLDEVGVREITRVKLSKSNYCAIKTCKSSKGKGFRIVSNEGKTFFLCKDCSEKLLNP